MTDSTYVLAPGQRVTDADGAPVSGAKLLFYTSGSTTPLTVYADAGLVTALGTTVYCDSGGYPVTAFGGTSKSLIYTGESKYKIVCTDADDVVLWTIDDVMGAIDTSAFGIDYAIPKMPVVVKSSAYDIVTADRGKLINCNPTGASFVVTLPDAVAVGDGWMVGVKHDAASTNNPVTIKAVDDQFISASGTTTTSVITLYGVGQTAWLISDGANWSVSGSTPAWMLPDIPYFSIEARLSAPPAAPVSGNRYIIAGTPSGMWASLGFGSTAVVEYDGIGGWFQYPRQSGWLAYIKSEGIVTQYRSGNWVDLTNVTAPLEDENHGVLVAHTTTDGTGGGAATIGAWTAIPYNSLTRLVGSGISFNASTHVVTLPAGQWKFNVRHGFYGTNVTQIRFRSVTTSTIFYSETQNLSAITSESEITPHSGVVEISGFLNSVEGEGFIAEYYCNATTGVEDLGCISPTAAGPENHGTLLIENRLVVQGPSGPPGPQGEGGLDAAFPYIFSTATSGAPASGRVYINNSNPSLATAVVISSVDSAEADMTSVISTFDSGTSENRAFLKITKEGATNNFMAFHITGAGSVVTGGMSFPVVYISSPGALANGDSLALLVVQHGDQGDPGTTVPDISGLTTLTSGVDPVSDYLIIRDTSATSHKKVSPAVLIGNSSPSVLGIAKATTSAEIVAGLASGARVIIPPTTTSIAISSGDVPAVMAGLHMISSTDTCDLIIPAGTFTFTGAQIARYSSLTSNIRLIGYSVDTTLNSVVSVSGTTGNWTVVYDVASPSGIVAGNVLKLSSVGPLPHLSGDNSILLRNRPIAGELAMPVALIGNITVTAGTNTASFGAVTTPALSSVIAVGDLVHVAGQTRVVTAVSTSSLTVSANWSFSATATRAYWTSRASAGTISTGGSASTTITGTLSSFTTAANVGDILLVNGEMAKITAIASSTSLTVNRALTISAGTSYTILVTGALHEGAHLVTGVSGSQVTTVNRSRSKPPINTVATGNVQCIQTVLYNSAGGDGLIADQGGSLRYLQDIALRGSAASSSYGISMDGSFLEGSTQLGTTSSLAIGDGVALVDWDVGIFAGPGSSVQTRGVAISGANTCCAWLLEGATGSLRTTVFSGSQSTGLQVNGGSTVVATEALFSGNSGDGCRLQTGAEMYAEIPFSVANGGMGIRNQGGCIETNEGVAILNGSSGVRLEGGEASTARMLLACNGANGVDCIELSDMDATEIWATGNAQSGIKIDFGRIVAPSCGLTGNGTNVTANNGSRATVTSSRLTGSVAASAGARSWIDLQSTDCGSGSITATGGIATVWAKSATNLGTLSPATLNRGDIDGNIINVGSDVSTVPQYAGMDLNGVGLSLTGEASASITAATGTGGSGEWVPTGFVSASVVRATSSAGFSVYCLGGAAAPPSNGRIAIIENVGANVIVLVSDDGTNGTAAYRFKFAITSLALQPSQSALLRYDGTLSRWMLISIVNAASTTAQGIVELATNAETITGTDTVRAVTPDGLKQAVTARTLAASAVVGTRLVNGKIVASVASSALTVALKTLAGADPSAADPVLAVFADGTVLTVTAATSLVISSGSTLGFANATPGRVWVLGFNDASTFRLGAVNCLDSELNIMPIFDGLSYSSTAEGGAGAADSAWTIYTGTAVSAKQSVPIAYLDWASGLVTAGTWSATPDTTTLWTDTTPLPGQVIGERRTSATGVVQSSTTAATPFDDTIPQITEGYEFITRTYTPRAAMNVVRVSARVLMTCDTVSRWVTAHIHKDAAADALAATSAWIAANAQTGQTVPVDVTARAGSASAQTYRLRAGYSGATGPTVTMNGQVSTRLFGGVSSSYLTVTELQG